ncbi:indolepyruvate ferredoxin oxidoreductase family protein [Novosphingobium malaysiense]|uniref:indolepyruvate ferredoxin oxidoreductase family protein n=1 Tax=Novosphingobium malaysiense TaxID=1348853 RepID=UPI0018CD9E7F|nr:indolepyruvate ferredoxin oxidoreductase family protein [Novosphingobium malaysiense]
MSSEHDKYSSTDGKVYLSGNQALVRMTVEQARRDRLTGLNTGGFVSGYRGSPLGHLDQEFTRAGPLLDSLDVRFQAGVNEDMAATAVWGTQQIGFFAPKFEGVFGLWYSKGPGIDRSGDALRHANLWGTSPKGGVVMAVGDDPMARSSSIQQQSEHTLASMCIPTFNAANVQDIHDFGLIGWQLSRYAGVWTAVKGVSDIYESWLAIDVDPGRTAITLPPPPTASVHTRWPDRSVDQDQRMLQLRLPAVHAFARLNRLNRVTHGSSRPRVGIMAAGKSWSDTLEALADLGIDKAQMEASGLALFKVGLVWPLEPETVSEFAQGLSELLIVEESRPVLEPQVKDILFNLPPDRRPRILGKTDAQGETWMPSHGELDPVIIARVLHRWLEPVHRTEAMDAWVGYLDHVDHELARPRNNVLRTPHFCSGCPHNTSTKVPSGSKQLAGIGCHWLANMMDRDVVTYPQMGGEGATWAGAAHFLEDEHIFVNLGDGTWYHSGSMAIRQAVAAGVNITYKILYNDAVAMTGGQPIDGPISVAQITHELRGEDVHHVAVVSSRPEQFEVSQFAPGTSLHHRDELELVQMRFRQEKGVSVIIYEQTCATELRRRRGKKLAEDPARRVVINDRVCEGCGDCSVQSNCLSVQPLETEFGRKRMIDQSACNKDFSCIKGFCPSFVTIEGGSLALPSGVVLDDALFAGLPAPEVCTTEKPFGVMVTGIGGTGVVTIANLIGSAAQEQGKSVQALALTGLAQKFGAVYCHLKVADNAEQLLATRLSVGQCDLLIGADIVTAASDESLSRLREGSTRAVVNEHETVTGAFTRNRDFALPVAAQREAIERFCGSGRVTFVEATELAERLTGNTIGANVMLLGFACQMGWLPVPVDALERAIEANGVAVKANLKVFALGRLLAHDRTAVQALADAAKPESASVILSESLEDRVVRRESDLVSYQDAALAERYRKLVDAVRAREQAAVPGSTDLTDAVARNFYKLLAYKDEYEVARLFSDGAFLDTVKQGFSGDYKLRFHMAPPVLSRIDPATGRPKKRSFGPWMLHAMRWLAKGKVLRGTLFDPFGYTRERRAERALMDRYEGLIEDIVDRLSPANMDAALALARWPEAIRGYGPVKEQAMAQTLASLPELRAAFDNCRETAVAA